MHHRNSERLSTSLTGTYRTPRGFECEVDVDDLSLGGCRVDDLRGGLQLGEYVQITVAGAGPYVAEVAWRQSTRVGLQFNRPLPAHIVRELTGLEVKATGPVPPPQEAPRFGQPRSHPARPSPSQSESAGGSAPAGTPRHTGEANGARRFI
ncbi:MAG: PilZ domain-containing protein [Pseudomonadota bacterium]